MKTPLVFVLAILEAITSPVLAADKPDLRIYYTANRQGEIEPCGCEVNQTGGLNRVEALLDEERKALGAQSGGSFFADSGDTFFSSPVLNPSRRKEELLRARVIAEGYRQLGVDAVTPGERDFAAGVDELKGLQKVSGATFLAANLQNGNGEPLFERFHLFHKGPWKIMVTGLIDEKIFQGVEGVKVQPAIETWKALLPILREAKPDMIILLSHLGLAGDRALASSPGGMDLIFGAHSLDVLTHPQSVGRVYLFQPQNAGAQLGIFDYHPSDPMRSDHRLVDLGKRYDKENAIAKLMARYRKNLRSVAMERAPSPSSLETPDAFVANAFRCRKCHEKQYSFWVGTKHASAYLPLYAKNQHFNPECIRCHSLGFEEPGGFSSIAYPIRIKGGEQNPSHRISFIERLMKNVFMTDSKTGALDSRLDPERYVKLKERYHAEIEKLENGGKLEKLYVGVQCEHCHGIRVGHPGVKTANVKKVSETTCRKCHAPPNAPDFDPTMIVKVACPRLGS